MEHMMSQNGLYWILNWIDTEEEFQQHNFQLWEKC